MVFAAKHVSATLMQYQHHDNKVTTTGSSKTHQLLKLDYGWVALY